jgi:hypothetical protein
MKLVDMSAARIDRNPTLSALPDGLPESDPPPFEDQPAPGFWTARASEKEQQGHQSRRMAMAPMNTLYRVQHFSSVPWTVTARHRRIGHDCSAMAKAALEPVNQLGVETAA